METRIRIDPLLMKEAIKAAREDGYGDLASLVNHILRLYVRGKIRMGLVVDPELAVGGEDDPVMLVGKMPKAAAPPPAVVYEEKRDSDGFIERKAVEGVATVETEDASSIDLSLFEGSPLMPIVSREEAMTLRAVLKGEATLFKDPGHQPNVRWIDGRGDRWGVDREMLDRLGERRTKG